MTGASRAQPGVFLGGRVPSQRLDCQRCQRSSDALLPDSAGVVLAISPRPFPYLSGDKADSDRLSTTPK